MSSHVILWRRMDIPGYESARLYEHESVWQLAGTAILVYNQSPCRLDYIIRCDATWETRSATVSGWVGEQVVDIELSANPNHEWQLNGKGITQVAGCIDLDLNFSPSTNLLPIRRLNLAIGQAEKVKAAWLRFPGFTLESLEQVYRRTGANSYRYESAGSSFVANLTVNEAGFVVNYPGIWKQE